MELMQLTIFDELKTQVVEKLVVGDCVKVRQEAIDLAEKSKNEGKYVENYYYLQEYRHLVGEIVKKHYGKNGICFEVSYLNKKEALFYSKELIKV